MLQPLQWIYRQLVHYTYFISWVTLGLLGILTLYVRYKTILLANPDVGGIESNVIYSILRVMDGYPLYENPEQPPFAVTQYSPIYYYLTVFVAKLLQLMPDDVYDIYVCNRCVSLVANGFYVWGIVKLARRLSLPMSVACLAGILAFVLLTPQSYGRPDSLYNAFVVWTIWAMCQWQEAGGEKRFGWAMILPALFTACALFSKQSGLCLLVIVGGYLLFFAQNFRQFLYFYAWFGLFFIILCVGLFGREVAWVYANEIQGVSNGIDFANFRYNLIDHYLRPFVWLVVPGLAISIRYAVFERGSRQIIGLTNTGLFVFALTTGLKWGSALNYFTEFTGVSGLLIIETLWQLRHTRSEWANMGRLGIALGIVWVIPVNAMNFNWMLSFGKPTNLTQYKREQAIAHYLKNKLNVSNTCLIYSTLYNSSYLNSFLFRNCVVPQQDLLIGSAYPRHTFNYAHLDQISRNGGIRYAITLDNETEAALSPPIYLARYRPIKSLYGYTIYQFDPVLTDNRVSTNKMVSSAAH